jgi:MOSC domain-containing protein YiiM
MSMPTRATLVAGKGITGDRYRTERNGPRQVTLIAAEDLAAIASFLRRLTIPPELVRRNLVTRGLNLSALKGRRINIGQDVLLEITGDCAPCSQMEANLGPGGYNAVRGRGGLTARILVGGTIEIRDEITVPPELRATS